MAQAVPQMEELLAPPIWRTVDFISDLHLHAREPATFEAWAHYLQGTPADAVFVLGDLFEVWVGDDIVGFTDMGLEDSFEARCIQQLRQAGDRLALFFMHGNRDFLVGQKLMGQCHATLLADPTVLTCAGQRWLLSHGDALCLSDVDYMQFRALVRSPAWQADFLAKPLAERQAIARGLRQQSESRKNSGASYGDLELAATRHWLEAADALTLIHGHTHQPAEHDLGDGLRRVVLSDWDVEADPARAQVLRLTSGGLQRINLAVTFG